MTKTDNSQWLFVYKVEGLKMMAYGVPRNESDWDWDVRGCQSSEHKISSKRRQESRRLFRKQFRASNRLQIWRVLNDRLEEG